MVAWQNYNPLTGVGDPSTPMDATHLDAAFAEKTTPADVDVKIAAQAVVDSFTYAPAAETTANTAAIATMQGSVMLVSELMNTAILTSGSISVATTIPVWVATQAALVDQAALTATATVAASDTDYWTVELIGYRAGVARSFASKTTKVTAGEALTSMREWNFDLITFSAFRVLGKGDVLAVRFTPTGSPPALVMPAITFRPAPTDLTPVAVILPVSDSVTRADSATSLGLATTGQAWIPVRGTWGVLGNQIYIPATDGSQNLAVIEAGTADVQVDVKLVGNPAAPSQGIAMRVNTANGDHLLLNGANLYSRINNVLGAAIGPAFSSTFVTGDTMRVTCKGSTITVYRQTASTGAFNQVMTTTTTINQTMTAHGLRANIDSSVAARFDDFAIVAAP